MKEFIESKNFFLSSVATIVVVMIFLVSNELFKLGLLEIFFNWFGKHLALIGIYAFMGIIGVVWLTLFIVFEWLNVYQISVSVIRRISSVKESQGG